jgi:Ser/Thr protein kinase RdoA (MazF antagonist)
MHTRAVNFPTEGRPRLGWAGLVSKPQRTALAAWAEHVPDREPPDLDRGAAAARRLWKRLGLRSAMCHADLHWGNLKVHARRVHPFDFDDCGIAPLAYDLAVVLYASDHGSLDRPTLMDHLLTGYHQTAPEPIPREAVLLLRWARARWLLGWVLERPELFEPDYLRTRALALVAECEGLERELAG